MAFGQAAIAGRGTLPECPEALAHVWQWFVDLRNAAPHGTPIGYGNIAAYFGLTRQISTPFEVGLIRRLDEAWLADAQKKAQQSSRRPAPRLSRLGDG